MKGYVVQNGKLVLAKLADPQLKPNHVIVRNLIAGVNHHDITALKNPNFEGGKKLLGFEGMGIVESVDPTCEKKFEAGQRVCYATAFGIGAFSEKISIHENFLLPVPDYISSDHAATLFKALAAHMLLFRTYTLRKGDVLGITSASGGVASYLAQWASGVGVKTIGLFSNVANKAIAAENGCVASFSYTESEKFIEQAKKYSGTGLGLNAFYDSMGIKAYAIGIKALAPFGLYVNYGDLSGELKGMAAKHFEKKALFFTTPSTFYSKANVAELGLTANMIFENIHNHILRPNIHRYKYSHLQQAFNEMQNGKIVGHKVLVVSDN